MSDWKAAAAIAACGVAYAVGFTMSASEGPVAIAACGAIQLVMLAVAFAVGLFIGRRTSTSKETRRTRVMVQATVRRDRVDLCKRHHLGVWPEVENGLAAAGVETLSIWSDPRDQTKLYMYFERAENADDGTGSAYRKKPKVDEWETYMEREFHSGWRPMSEWYTLKACGTRTVQVSTNSLPPCYDMMRGDAK